MNYRRIIWGDQLLQLVVWCSSHMLQETISGTITSRRIRQIMMLQVECCSWVTSQGEEHSSASDLRHRVCSDMHCTWKSLLYAKCIPVQPTPCLLDCVQQQNPFVCQSLTPRRHDDTQASCREICTVLCRQKRRRFRHISVASWC